MSRAFQWRACTKKTCGSTFPAISNLSTLAHGATQKLVGITDPHEVETFITRAPRKRKRIAADSSFSSKLSTNPDLDYTAQLLGCQRVSANINPAGEPIISLVQIYSSLLAKRITIDKVSRFISPYYAAVAASLIMEWGSPVAFQELSLVLNAFEKSLVFPEIQENVETPLNMASLVKRLQILDHFEANQILTTIAIRYHLAKRVLRD